MINTYCKNKLLVNKTKQFISKLLSKYYGISCAPRALVLKNSFWLVCCRNTTYTKKGRCKTCDLLAHDTKNTLLCNLVRINYVTLGKSVVVKKKTHTSEFWSILLVLFSRVDLFWDFKISQFLCAVSIYGYDHLFWAYLNWKLPSIFRIMATEIFSTLLLHISRIFPI